MQSIRAVKLAALAATLLFVLPALAGPPAAAAKASPEPAARYAECPAGSHRDPQCLEANARGTGQCPCQADAGSADPAQPKSALVAAPPPSSPAPGARRVRSGTIKLECPAGTDKLCNGNDCGCWTRNE
jgi:hypothetical protein